jgi:hypothetical protein
MLILMRMLMLMVTLTLTQHLEHELVLFSLLFRTMASKAKDMWARDRGSQVVCQQPQPQERETF